MSAGLEGVCREMADYLNSRGVPAVTAWPMEARRISAPPPAGGTPFLFLLG